jgi:hypothetical protein
MLDFGYLHSAIVGGSASCLDHHIRMNTNPSINENWPALMFSDKGEMTFV